MTRNSFMHLTTMTHLAPINGGVESFTLGNKNNQQ